MDRAQLAAEAVCSRYARCGVDAIGLATETALVVSVEQGIAEIRSFNLCIGEAAAGRDDPCENGIAQVGVGEISPIHQRVGEVGTTEVRLGKGALGQDRAMQHGIPEIRTAGDRTGKGGVGEVLTVKVAVALVGQGVIHLVLKQSSVLEAHSFAGV